MPNAKCQMSNEKLKYGSRQNDLRDRTKAFSLRTIRLCASLPRNREGDVIGRQLVRSGTSVGANYRAACKSRSQAEFIAKMGIVEEEADESAYWIELLISAGLTTQEKASALHAEALELVAIAASSRKTARSSLIRQSVFGNRHSKNEKQ